MRLIDAEKCPCIVCEDTRNAHCTYEHRSCEKFCNWLNNNAFDMEKVVEQIHDKYCHKCRNILGKQSSEEYCKSVKCEIDALCDIVKKGGVE